MAKPKAQQEREQAEQTVEPTILAVGTTVPPKGATIEGLADTDEIEIYHPDSGQAYGVSVAAYRDLYEPQGFVATRMADNRLLPGDPRTPDPDTIPEDVPDPITPSENTDGDEG